MRENTLRVITRAPDAAFSEQQVLVGNKISAHWAIAVYYKMTATDVFNSRLSLCVIQHARTHTTRTHTFVNLLRGRSR